MNYGARKALPRDAEKFELNQIVLGFSHHLELR